MDKIRIVAEMHIKPDALEEARSLLQDMASASQAEEGNLAYMITEDSKDPRHIFILEEWKSTDAITDHNKANHFRKFQKEIAPFVEVGSVTTLQRLF